MYLGIKMLKLYAKKTPDTKNGIKKYLFLKFR